ncbi:MAG: hypothetical protein R3323_07700 [Wenzhouxiangellaceae bacterium]|nr:hypothetical protein [Wenzhouxiangellaceae bacterium]
MSIASVRATLLVLALLPAWSHAMALDVSPQPATFFDEIVAEAVLGLPCGRGIDFGSVSMTVDGTQVSVEFGFLPPPDPPPPCVTPPPYFADFPLGRFDPGTYDLEVIGRLDGAPHYVAATDFTVSGAPGPFPAEPIPALGPLGLSLLALSLALATACAWRRGPRTR